MAALSRPRIKISQTTEKSFKVAYDSFTILRKFRGYFTGCWQVLRFLALVLFIFSGGLLLPHQGS